MSSASGIRVAQLLPDLLRQVIREHAGDGCEIAEEKVLAHVYDWARMIGEVMEAAEVYCPARGIFRDSTNQDPSNPYDRQMA